MRRQTRQPRAIIMRQLMLDATSRGSSRREPALISPSDGRGRSSSGSDTRTAEIGLGDARGFAAFGESPIHLNGRNPLYTTVLCELPSRVGSGLREFIRKKSDHHAFLPRENDRTERLTLPGRPLCSRFPRPFGRSSASEKTILPPTPSNAPQNQKKSAQIGDFFMRIS